MNQLPDTKHERANMPRVYLMILDGFGEGKNYPGNAITRARMPGLTKLRQKYPWTLLEASGEAVGLPAGTQGGSEVGHFTIGAGRVVFQTLEEINRSIRDRSFFKKKPLLDAIATVKKNHSSLHLLGMISDQGVHSHLDHLFALLELAKEHKVESIFIHAITDGRDVPERTAAGFIEKIQKKIAKLGMEKEEGKTNASEATIATIIGRYYAMDRDNNWDRTQKAYDLYTLGQGTVEHDPLLAIQHAYERGAPTDYYIDPIMLDQNGTIKNEDAVIFWNFRTDRTRQLTYCFTHETQLGFTPQKNIEPFFVCFGDYSKKAPVVFPTHVVSHNLGSVISQQGLRQLRIAETEKYAHVTYFFNSQVETPTPQEDRILIASPKTISYAEKPEMSAVEITDRVVKEIASEKYNLIVQNFANPDLVGHSGNFAATVKALETVDQCLEKIAAQALEHGYTFLLTGDHGNAEYMVYEKNGEPCPSHTTNPVICLVALPSQRSIKLTANGSLQDIAPTILNLMNIEKPSEMTGKSLIKTQS